MRVPKQPNEDRRSADRVGIPSEKPVYIETVLDGKEVGLLVENFSTGGALLICPEGSDSLQAGKHLPNCLLVLPQSGHIRLNATIRWHVWPKVGVQFDSISADARDRISRFLQAIEV